MYITLYRLLEWQNQGIIVWQKCLSPAVGNGALEGFQRGMT